jgi:hypothetical protein
MFVTSITVSREGYYGLGTKADPAKPFNARVEVHGRHGKVELQLSAEMSARIVEIIADEIAAAGRATAEAMTATCLEANPTKQLAA